ncbi:MAG: hypothetical protein WB808_12145 [Candidatus Dormiibacterota bacterium]
MRQLARVLLWIESAAWVLLGALLIAGGLIVLRGGTGLPGVVNVDEPGFGSVVAGWAVGAGAAMVGAGSWGIWTARAVHRGAAAARTNALVFCCLWIVLGLVWIVVATTPIPGAVTIVVNALILSGFILRSPSAATGRDAG